MGRIVKLQCAYCNKWKMWPKYFPVSMYAKCNECYKGDEEETERKAQKKIWRLFRLFGVFGGKS